MSKPHAAGKPLEVRCTCGVELSGYNDMERGCLRIWPCENCLEAAKKVAYIQGRSDGEAMAKFNMQSDLIARGGSDGGE